MKNFIEIRTKEELIKNERLTLGQSKRLEETKKDIAVFIGDELRLISNLNKLLNEDLRDVYAEDVRFYYTR